MKNYQEELKVVLQILSNASKIVMDIYHGDFAIQYKKDQSEVTTADIASEEIIKKGLLHSFPNYAILSEETYDTKERLNNDYCWIVDPLDGTKDFVNKTNNFSINIALSYQNEIVLGAISVPFYQKVYYALKNQGSYKLEKNHLQKIHVSDKKDHLTMLTSQFFFKEKNKYDQHPSIEKMIALGSSYKACLIAEGKAEICVKEDPHSKEWDTAPSEIIIAEAGGIMGNIYGQKIYYNKKDVYNHQGFIIANHEEVFNQFKMEEECK